MPKISVIMPVYNGEKYLRETMDSILGQTFTDFEFIVLNDASKDSTEEIIKSYDDDRIVYLKNEQNLGVAGTLNRGLENAKGEYIARIDADDIALPKRFAKQIKYMEEHKNVGVLGSDIIIFGEGLEDKEYTFSHNKEEAKAGLFFKSSIAHPTVIIRSSVLKDHSLKYTEKYNGFEDFALWWNIAKYSDIEVLPECLVKYRQHSGQVTKKHKAYYEGPYREFFDERISVFGLLGKKSAEDLVYRFCTSAFDGFSEEELNEIVDYFGEIMAKNKELKIFDQKAFKENVTAVLWRIISSSNVEENKRKVVIHKAIKCEAFSKIFYFKILVHGILDKYIGAK
ncbi:MAG: glycosyltransferase [Clostridia bacterium]|nr:glycosyltransferase [Clostridia bacterium]